VVVNQVRRAIGLYRKLRDAGLDVLLLHSRFNYSDRARIENQLEPKRGRILVATQAVEVSLNVSFDECFSDIAPLESLQQRFGRCNRRGNLPKAAPVTVCYKCSPLPYDIEHLQAVLAVLKRCCDGSDQVLLTEELTTSLLDSSYPEGMKIRLKESILSSLADLTRYVVNEFTPYGPRDIEQQQDLEKRWQDLFDGEEILPDVLLEKARREPTWLGRARYLVPVPSYWMRRLNAEWNEELMCLVAPADYSTETGIELRLGK